ncbi:MAG: hypothetical protein R3C26_21200 [Calditrichia bacterium]
MPNCSTPSASGVVLAGCRTAVSVALFRNDVREIVQFRWTPAALVIITPSARMLVRQTWGRANDDRLSVPSTTSLLILLNKTRSLLLNSERLRVDAAAGVSRR